MSHDYQLCPVCEEEFTLAVSECSECRVALVSPDALEPALPPEDFPTVDALHCVRVGPLPWTRALSNALGEVGIPHRVEADTRGESEGGVDRRRFDGIDVFGTWVRPEDADAAARVDAALFAHLEPESEPVAEGIEACPACEEPLPSDVVECPGCGLAFA